MVALFQFGKGLSDWLPKGFSGPSGTHGRLLSRDHTRRMHIGTSMWTLGRLRYTTMYSIPFSAVQYLGPLSPSVRIGKSISH